MRRIAINIAAILVLGALLSSAALATTPPPKSFLEGMSKAEQDQVYQNIRHLSDPVSFEDMQNARRELVGQIRAAFGLKKGDEGFSLNYDRNKDGVIDEQDILELGYLVEDRLLAIENGRSYVPSHGDVNIPGFRVDFTDQSGNYATHTAAYFNTLFSDDGSSSTNSMREYYREASYDKLFLSSQIWDPVDSSNTTSGWYNYNKTSTYVKSNSAYVKIMVREAIVRADADIDFSQFDSNNDGYVDMVSIIYAGDALYGTQLNPHQSSLSDQYETDDGVIVARYTICAENDGMGVFAHEFGHTMNLPDLYDTDNSSDGIGQWGLMGSGAHLPSGSATSPSHFTAWEKIELGWVIPRYVTSDALNQTLQPWATSPDCLKVWTGGADHSEEYFLLTYRRKTGFESSLPGEGILITHIDEGQRRTDNKDNEIDDHRLVDVEEADGLDQLDNPSDHNWGDATDPYYSSNSPSDGEFSPTTYPDSDSYEDGGTKVRIYGFNDKGGSSMECDVEVSDSGSPILNITGPTDGGTINGTQTVEVSVVPTTVDDVTFYLDGDSVFVDDTPPYQYSWNTGQSEDFQHELRVVADNGGKLGSDTHTVFVKTAAVYPFSDDMEADADKWTVFDYSGGSSDGTYINSKWAITEDDSYDGEGSWRFWVVSGSGPCNFNEFDMLVSDPINLSGSTQPKLTFYHKYKVPWDIDYMLTMDVSTDNGDTWTTELNFTGEKTSWTKQSKILDTYAGQEIRIRFRAQSSSGSFVGSFIGWWIDQLIISEGADSEPVVTLTLPGELNPRLSGPVAQLAATAIDDDAIDRVEFYVGTTLVGTDYSDPYEITFDSSQVMDGSSEIEARAWDSAGQDASDFADAVVDNEGDLPPYNDNFDSGLDKWWVRDLGGTGHVDFFDQGWWHIGSDGRLFSAGKAYMGGNRAWSGGYPPGWGENDEMNSYFISFSGVDSPELDFWHMYYQNSDPTYRDMTGEVRVSIDEGQNWSTVTSFTDLQQTAWTHVESVDLSAFEDEPLVLIQFRLTSDSNVTAPLSNFDKWFIDDVSITGDVVDPPPSSPTGLSAIGLTSRVWLDWNDNTDDDFNHYDVFRAISIAGPYTRVNSSDVFDSEYLDEGLTNGTTYYYRVKAVDDGDHESGYSNTDSATPSVSAAPSISITFPADGGFVTGGLTLVTVTATDPEGAIDYVRFSVNGDVKDTLTAPPYQYELDGAEYTNGQSLTILAEIRDDHWLTDDDTVMVTVDKLLPSLTFPNPDDGHGLSVATLMTADAGDANGITRVEFRLDDSLVLSDDTAPYQWQFDAPGLGNGAYVVSASAFDPAGNVRSIENLVFSNVLTGDANGDGTVDELDVAAIAMLYGLPFGDEDYRPYVDCNGDETIDERDVGVVGYNFGQS